MVTIARRAQAAALVVAAAVPVTAVQLTEGILWSAASSVYESLVEGKDGGLVESANKKAKIAEGKAAAAARAAEAEK